MKRPLAAAVAAAFAVVALAAPATAATPAQRIAKLERLVKKQQKDITALKKQAREAEELATAGLLFSICSTAVTADAFMSTWSTMNQVENRAVIGTQTPVAEPACSRLQVPRTQATPPSLNAFSQLMRLLQSPFSALSSVFGL